MSVRPLKRPIAEDEFSRTVYVNTKTPTWKGIQAKAWRAYTSLQNELGFSHHQIFSYNWFVNFGISRIIEQYPIVFQDGSKIEFSNPVFRAPEYTDSGDNTRDLTPHLSKILGLTYTSELLIDLKLTTNEEIIQADTIGKDKKGVEEKKKVTEYARKVHLCHLPVMLKSCLCVMENKSEEELNKIYECALDPGGYFIIGTGQNSNSCNPSAEKVLVSQERMAYNQVFVFNSEEAEVRCQDWQSDNVTTIKVVMDQQQVITVNFAGQVVPLWLVFRILGVEDDETVISLIDWGFQTKPNKRLVEELYPSIRAVKYLDINTKKSAIKTFIGSLKQTPEENRASEAKRMIKSNLFHVFKPFSLKAVFLGYMVRRLLLVRTKQQPPDDRDHFANKRVDTAGELMYVLFRYNFIHFCKKVDTDMKADHLAKTVEELRHSKLSEAIRKSLSSGDWPTNSKHNKATVSQTVSRINYPCLISSCRSVNTSTDKNSKSSEARNYHGSQTCTCPIETPSSKEDLGLAKKLSMSATITIPEDPSPVYTMLSTVENLFPLNSISDLTTFSNSETAGIVFVNCLPIYWCINPEEMVETLRKLRVKHRIFMVSMVLLDTEIHIHCDGGRLTRPFLKCKKGRPLIERCTDDEVKDWRRLLERNVLEYIDVCESDNIFCYEGLYYADKEGYAPSKSGQVRTHCEIHPSLLYGIGSQTICGINTDPGPRDNYQATMGRHCIGLPSTNILNRWDTEHSMLFYPQKRLVISEAQKLIKQDELPTGMSCVVAIGCFSGYSIEDGSIWNKAAFDRGLGRFLKFKVYSDSARVHNNGSMDSFCKPQCTGVQTAVRVDYDKLDDDGTIPKGIPLNSRDIIMGKITVSKNSKEAEDSSTQLCCDGVEADAVERGEESYSTSDGRFACVDDVMRCEAGDGYPTTRVKFHVTHYPEIGDKFSTTQAQKGTVGMIYPQEDMPWSIDTGMVPDCILNTHCLPSRMTAATLLECLGGKIAAVSGERYDMTPFDGQNAEELCEAAKKLGFSPSGKEMMYSGITGEPLGMMTIGIIYMQRLKQVVQGKIHARARGNVSAVTRQPPEGRAKGGGLKISELQRDCLISHGVATTIEERMSTLSDRIVLWFCSTCGKEAIVNEHLDSWKCVSCQQHTQFVSSEVNHIFKLIQHSMMGAGMIMRAEF